MQTISVVSLCLLVTWPVAMGVEFAITHFACVHSGSAF